MGGAGTVLLIAVVGGLAWYVHVRAFPWKDCPRCGGARRNHSGDAHRDCAKCGATGRVRRFGARKERH